MTLISFDPDPEFKWYIRFILNFLSIIDSIIHFFTLGYLCSEMGLELYCYLKDYHAEKEEPPVTDKVSDSYYDW